MSTTRRSVLQETIPLRGELLAHWLPSFAAVWAVTAVGALLLGLAWRAAGSAPDPLTLVATLSSVVWGLGYVLSPAWQGLLKREHGLPLAASGVWRGVWLIALLIGSGVALSVALAGVTLAYDMHAVYFTARPIDELPQSWTAARLVAWALLNAALPWFMLSLGSLTLLQSFFRRAGVVLWLAFGIILHSALLSGGGFDWPLTPGGIATSLVTNLSSSDAVLRDHMLAPVHSWLTVLWTVALITATAGLLVRPASRTPPNALGHAMAAGFMALTLRTVILGARWLHDPTVLVPDRLDYIGTTLCSTTVLVWLLLASGQPPRALHELRRAWWGVLLLAGLGAYLGLPEVIAGSATQTDELVAMSIAAGLLLSLLGAFALLLRLRRPLVSGEPVTIGSPALVAVSVILLSMRSADGEALPLAALKALTAAAHAPDQRGAALAVGAACLTVAAAGLWLPRSLDARRLPRIAASTAAPPRG